MSSKTQENIDLNEKENTTLVNQEMECITELDGILDSGNDTDKNTASPTTAENNSYVLEEFDEIIKEINIDIPNKCVSLDEVDDVLKNINNYGIDKNSDINNIDEMLLVPTFDFDDIIESHLIQNANYNDDAYIDINYWEGVYKADVISISSEESQLDSYYDRNINNFKTNVDINKTNDVEIINVDDLDDEADAIEAEADTTDKVNESIGLAEFRHSYVKNDDTTKKDYKKESSELSSEKKDVRMVNGLKNEKLKHIDKDEETEVTECLNDNRQKTIQNDHPTKVSYKVESSDSKEEGEVLVVNNNFKAEDNKHIINVDEMNIDSTPKEKQENNKSLSFDCNVEEMKKSLNDTKNAEENEESTKTNDFTLSNDSDDDGYRSSDFEFITEDEATFGLINNTNKRKVTNKNLKVEKDRATKLRKIGQSGTKNDQEDTSKVRNETITRDENAVNNAADIQNFSPKNYLAPKKIAALESFGSSPNKLPAHNSGSNILDPSFYFEKTNGERLISYDTCYRSVSNFDPSRLLFDDKFKGFDPNITGIKNLGPSKTEQKDDCEMNSFVPSNGEGFNNFGAYPRNMPVCSGINNLGPATSNTQENGGAFNSSGPSLQIPVQINSPDFDPVIEKWRAFKIRNQNRPLVLDYSYRKTHNVLQGHQYYQLFDPTLNPIVNNMGALEKKNLFPRCKKLAAYKGIGFDMSMMAGGSDGEDDEAKEEARETGKKILALYPEDNRKRRRSRRF